MVKISTHNSLAVRQMANGTSILTDSQRKPTTKIPPKVKMLDCFDGWNFFLLSGAMEFATVLDVPNGEQTDT